jgi:hypothetical protein
MPGLFLALLAGVRAILGPAMRLRWSLLAVLLAASCGDGPAMMGVMPPPGHATATIAIALTAGGQPAILPARTGDLIIDTAVFAVDTITLIGDRDGGEDSLRVRGQTLEFKGGAMIFELPDAPPALYSGLSLELHAPDGDGHGGDSDRAQAFSVAGKTAAGVPFVVADRHEVKVELRAGDGMELAPGKPLLALVRFDLDRWFKDVIVSPDGDHGGDSHDAAAGQFAQNLAASASLVFNPPRSE